MNVEIKSNKSKRYFVLKYAIILYAVCSFTACKSRNDNVKIDKTCALTIVCDSSYNQDLFYDFHLYTKDDTIRIQKIKHDSLRKRITLRWDSLKKDEYQFEIISVFQQKNRVSFNLNRDTTIQIRNKFTHEITNQIPKVDLLKSDTICFAFQTCGCSYGIATYMLTRNNGQYRLTGSKWRGWDSINKIVSPEIIQDLNQIQLSCLNQKLHKYRATRAYQFMLLSHKKVFYFDDMYSGDTEQFGRFKEKYIQ